jgi:hypothetical protein
MPSSWWAEVDTTDGTKGRAAKDDETELATDWIDFDDTAETGWLRVKWSGTLASSGTPVLRIYPPVAANSSYAASDTYGSDNAYDPNWEGYWPDGGETDRTSNGNDGTANGGVTIGGATGKVGDATDFDGSNDYISCADSASLSVTGSITLFCWLNIDSAPSSFYSLIRKRRVTSDSYQFLLNSSSQPQLFIDTGSPVNQTGSALSTSTWEHCVGSWDSSNIRVYNNGSLSGGPTAQTGSMSDTTDTLNIGGTDDQSWTVDGRMDDVQLHSTARSADWISHEYDQSNDNATFWGTWTWSAASSADDGAIFQRIYRGVGIGV